MTDDNAASTELLDSIEALKDLPHEEIVDHLAQLPPLLREEYGKKICRARGWTLKTLRAEIAKTNAEDGTPDSDTFIEELTPAETPVVGLDLAPTIFDIFQAHVKAGEHDYTIATLWAFLTYCYDDFNILPKLLINSPQKRCGKSTLLELLEAVVNKGMLVSGISAASIYRIVDQCKPCLLLDEADSYMKHDENIRGIVNAGHKKRLAYICRCVGDNPEPKKFSTWSPMAIAGIGKQDGTVMDRSIVINMRRKLPGESVCKIPNMFYEKRRILRMQLLRWAEDHHEAVQGADPVLPPSNNDRMTNNWEPLFSIAEVIGDEWPDKVTEAFKAASAQDVDEDVAIMMLADLREILKESDTGRMHSTDIVTELLKKEGRPWPEWRKGFPITPTALSYLLKPFDVRPGQLKIHGKNLNGYTLEGLEDVFQRYLPPVLTSTPLPANATNGSGVELQQSKNPTANSNSYPSTQAKGRPVEPCEKGVDITKAAAPTSNPSNHAEGRGVEVKTPLRSTIKEDLAKADTTREVDTSHVTGG